jgi:hypothetical protein
MAEFSKQYCEIYEPDLKWDFDIEEEASNIPKGHYKPIICEGFGFLGIGVKLDGNITILIDDSDGSYENAGSLRQIEYKKYIELHKSKSQGI